CGDRERHHGDEQQGREAAQADAGRGGVSGGEGARDAGMRRRGGLVGGAGAVFSTRLGRLAGGAGAVFSTRLAGGAGAVFATRLGRLAGAKWARRLPGGVSRGGGHTFIFACSGPVVHPIDRAGESDPARVASGRALSSAFKAACTNLGEGVAALRRRL